MEERKVGIVTCLLLLLVACTPQPPAPLEVLANDMAAAEAACIQACAGADSTASIALSEGSRLYTTADAICAQKENKLLCGICPCAIASNVSIAQAGNYTCEFAVQAEDERVTITCT